MQKKGEYRPSVSLNKDQERNRETLLVIISGQCRATRRRGRGGKKPSAQKERLKNHQPERSKLGMGFQGWDHKSEKDTTEREYRRG